MAGRHRKHKGEMMTNARFPGPKRARGRAGALFYLMVVLIAAIGFVAILIAEGI